MPEQQVRFTTTSDGVRIGYAVTGDGYPLVWVPGWLSHAEIDWDYPGLGERYHELTRDFMLVRLDKRGTGLSARKLGSYSREAWVRDVEAVVAQEKLKRFALAGYSEGGPIAVEYAVRHADNVSHLILMGTGEARPEERLALVPALVTIIKTNWGSAVKVMTDLFLGENAHPEAQRLFAQYQKQAAYAEDAAVMLEDMPHTYDISHLAKEVRVPTLVIHGREDHAVPIDFGQRLAALIPGAAFKSVSGPHIPGRKQSAEIQSAILEFVLGKGESAHAAVRRAPASSAGVRTVLFTDLVGHTAMMRRLGDARGREVLREHERITREKIAEYDGNEIKTDGDSFMVSFGSVASAMECAVDLQRAFAERNESADEPLRVRMGMNAGEPVEDEGDLFGETVILASRIASEADAGEILVPEPVRHLLAGKGFVFADRGEFVPKGFEDTVRLFEVRWA
jgi:class 3 adenylate cyclase/pimeloyl-ACP methyl ester carboxylesterase